MVKYYLYSRPLPALTALVSIGFPSSKFTFQGFLPKKKKDIEKVLKEISECEKTSVVYESPHRLKKLLIELKEYCGKEREIVIFRELTKKFEEHIGTNAEMILNFFEKKEVLGEITVVIDGIKNDKLIEFDKFELKKELNDLVNAGLSLSSASKYLAKKNGLTKNIVYSVY